MATSPRPTWCKGLITRAGLNSRWPLTGIVATMPYIALQLIGMGVVIKAMGLTGELPIVAAFVILALYTYSSGLRAPALIAFVKDIMIYIVVLVAVVVVPTKLGGYGAVFTAASDAFTAKGGATGLTLKPAQMLPYVTLALGSALAAFMYPHTLTGIFASKSADTIRKNAILLPAYTLLLGPDRAARLHGLCRQHQGDVAQRRGADAVQGVVSRPGSPALRLRRSRSARWCRPR